MDDIYANYNRKKMRMYPLLAAFLAVLTLVAQPREDVQEKPKDNPRLYLVDGIYYSDRAQTQLYTGDYREYYDNNTLKLEMQIKNGQPEGPYIVYFENRKPKEVRSYKEGKLHGLWRSYDISGQVVSEAEYRNGAKHGTWRIWDELGNLRYEMSYYEGNKIGIWKMWSEEGELLDEKRY